MGDTEWNAERRDVVQAAAERNERYGNDCSNGFLYRIAEMRYTERVRLYLTAYAVHHTTPCGHVLCEWSGARRRFVHAGATKRYACTTVDGALESFVRRKQRQIGILTHQLRRAQSALALAGGTRPTDEYGDDLAFLVVDPAVRSLYGEIVE